VLNCCN